ncbi:fatty acid cis/trans isomerase [Desulfosediminicola flagellatus]|uniref:fatty acid cis/trans isomerase n=1 Tax=Desulfosediminicola flagellatus TaxID=2569541 RepID=UPI00142EFA15|nr:fatty acid cis/trans isomerase [Desulfosediminicola flagellatus]
MNRIILAISVLITISLVGCASQAPPEKIYEFTPPDGLVSYEHDVKPVLKKRCVVCHSCYNSPCQLKMTSWEGMDRGASKKDIYNAQRLKTMDPTRLFVDAENTEEWREKGFFSVKPEANAKIPTEYEDSIMFMLLDHKRKKPGLISKCRDEATFNSEDDLTCSETTAEVDHYLSKHPNRGMPFGFPQLKKSEFDTIVGWLSQGASGPDEKEEKALKEVPEPDRIWIDKWEELLNLQYAKNEMTARYLYEHLYLAHLTFKTGSENFYELVRSTTEPGEPIKIIATTRPYDSPGTPRFFYRFRKIHSILVHKTHMVFPMDQRQYDRVNELFIEKDWGQRAYTQSYEKELSANPFEVFEQIPVHSRYEWLLDNARYTLMTFIRGPVCKGQVALNVVNDQFWVLFMDPDYDVSVQDPQFLIDQFTNLRMPAEEGSQFLLFKSLMFWKKKYKRWSHNYYKARQNAYASTYPEGIGVEAIWKGNTYGDRPYDEPVLTVFRHFDSASVHRGARGKLPKTAWVIDYPILERIYYSLVAGFDVYGVAGHQLSTRRYMDALRIEAESSFLQFMPKDKRQEIMNSWYKGKYWGELDYQKTAMPAKFPFAAGDPKRQFLEEVVEKHIAQSVKDIAFDHNYLREGEQYPKIPDSYTETQDYIDGFLSIASKQSSFLKHVNDHNANVAWVRIRKTDDTDLIVSMVADRWHDNVKIIYGEKLALDPSKDSADFIEGFVGSYPNYFFDVKAEDLPDFFDTLHNYDGSKVAVCRLEKYGINRAEDKFWDVYDWFQGQFSAPGKEPSDPDKYDDGQYGIVDLNRYYSLAMKKDLYEGGTQETCEQKYRKP